MSAEDKKFHWIKIDFNKWKDEDDSDDEAGPMGGGGGGGMGMPGAGGDFEEMMRQMGGLGGVGELSQRFLSTLFSSGNLVDHFVAMEMMMMINHLTRQKC